MGSLLSCFFSWFSIGSSSCSRVIWPQKPAQVVVQRRGPLRDTEPETISAVWWLFNGHLQTGYTLIDELSQADPVMYERKFLRLKDGGTLGLDFAPPTAAGRVFDKKNSRHRCSAWSHWRFA